MCKSMSLALLRIHIFCYRDGGALVQTLKGEIHVSDDINITNVKSITNVSNNYVNAFN